MEKPSREIVDAIDEVFERTNASEDFKNRLRQLIYNAIGDNVTDPDVLGTIELAPSQADEDG